MAPFVTRRLRLWAGEALASEIASLPKLGIDELRKQLEGHVRKAVSQYSSKLSELGYFWDVRLAHNSFEVGSNIL